MNKIKGEKILMKTLKRKIREKYDIVTSRENGFNITVLTKKQREKPQ